MAFGAAGKDQPARQRDQHRGQQAYQQNIDENLAQGRDLGPAARDGQKPAIERVGQGQVNTPILRPRRADRDDVIALVIPRDGPVAVNAPVGTNVAEDQPVRVGLTRFRLDQPREGGGAGGSTKARHVLCQIGADRLFEGPLGDGITGREAEQADDGEQKHQQKRQT